MAAIRKSHAEVWQENETSIILKMLSDSLRSHDSDRTEELKRSLLELDRKSDKDSFNEDDAALNSFQLPVAAIKRGNSASNIELMPYSPKSLPDSPASAEEKKSNSFSPQDKAYIEKAIKQNTKQHDMQVSIMLVGGARTGKTSLMNALAGLHFKEHTPCTVG